MDARWTDASRWGIVVYRGDGDILGKSVADSPQASQVISDFEHGH